MPIAATEGRPVGPVASSSASGAPAALRRHFAPAPSGVRVQELVAQTVGEPRETTDPTVITSITKTWDQGSSSWDIGITWSGGSAPYTVSRSASPAFEWGVQTLGKGVAGTSTTDRAEHAALDQLYFNVTDTAFVSPAVEGLGYDPEPPPGPPTPVSPLAWWGTAVELAASYLDPIVPANLSFFNRLVAKAVDVNVSAGSEYADLAEFTVPLDARSSIPARVHAHARTSPGSSLVLLRPGLSYPNVRGLVWAPQTGRLWLAADNLVAEVDLFRVDPVSSPKVTDKVKPYISRVGDSGSFVVIDGGATPGPASIFQVNVTSGAESHFAFTKDDGFTRDLQPMGIALSPDGTVCYVADGSSGSVVRIPAGAGPGSSTIVDSWGGRSDFGFADPAPLDVSVGGQVLLVNAADGAVWELVSAGFGFNTGTIAGSGNHVLAIDRELSELGFARYIYTAAPAATEAFNLAAIGSNPPAYHGGMVYSDGASLDLYPLDRQGQKYPIAPRDPQRVVISNAEPRIPYTSPLQVADRVIELSVTGWPGLEMRLELIDPPDTAAYAPDGGWDMGRPKALPYEGNDNVEDLQTADVGLALDPGATTWEKKLNVTPGQNKTATVYLKVTNRYAGDNYQVRVKKCVPSGCGADGSGVLHQRVVGLSPVFTAWKRIFIERDRMFRKGGVLAEDYLTEVGTCGGQGQGPCCGEVGALPCNQVKVFGWSTVSPGDWIVLFDQLQSLSNYSFFFERIFPVRLVIAVSELDPDGYRVVTLDQALDRNFRSSSVTDATDRGYGYMPNFSNGYPSGLGVVSGCDLSSPRVNGSESCFFDADLRGLELPYNDALVEVFAPRTGVSFVPFLPDDWYTWQLTEQNPPPIRPIDYFNWLWFAHQSSTASNYRQFLGASSSMLGSQYGLTTLSSYHWGVVFRGSIESASPGRTAEEVDNFTQHTTTHELAHMFTVNACSVQGHHNSVSDPVVAWCQVEALCPQYGSPLELCVMNNGDILGQHSQRWDGFVEFDAQCLFLGDTACQDPPGTEPRPGSIRGVEDPLF